MKHNVIMVVVASAYLLMVGCGKEPSTREVGATNRPMLANIESVVPCPHGIRFNDPCSQRIVCGKRTGNISINNFEVPTAEYRGFIFALGDDEAHALGWSCDDLHDEELIGGMSLLRRNTSDIEFRAQGKKWQIAAEQKYGSRYFTSMKDRLATRMREHQFDAWLRGDVATTSVPESFLPFSVGSAASGEDRALVQEGFRMLLDDMRKDREKEQVHE